MTMPETTSQGRTDGVPEKLRLMEAALAAGRTELVASLAESIQETIRFAQQIREDPTPPVLGCEDFVPVAGLPPAWAAWASGWAYCKTIALFETVGLERSREPVDVSIGLRLDQAADPLRELRVARLDAEEGLLHEVPCQAYAESRQHKERRCRLLFFADVPRHGRATYLVFFDNPHAEWPQYTTDLHVRGEGYGLEVGNQHYVARLSEQMGQLERLISRREHGLELYAGGKGHGEPPCIDWGNDYVDEGGFQKLRLRNWPSCPNHEVVRGPLFVRVRRWGFPYSPVHPLFTPSRLHIDQTYTFYAGLPHFLKEGRMEAIADVRIEAMRDDEWVFSGYSFNETLWVDRRGKLHEGGVPAEQANDLWGVGFFHRDSRDSFLALRLEHAAEGGVAPSHGGVPSLHYPGHGQLWSRYPAQGTRLRAGAVIRQKNAYVLQAYAGPEAAGRVEAMYHRLKNPLEARAERLPPVRTARAAGALARDGETAETARLKPAIWKALREVRDEQLYTVDANVVDMGYVYDVRYQHGTVDVLVTMPHRGRPVYDFLVSQGGGRVTEGIRERVLRLPEVRDVVVDLTWEPPWTVARLTDAGRRAMGLPV
jgi:metal-sulfur cluster biosynthetic enzyme